MSWLIGNLSPMRYSAMEKPGQTLADLFTNSFSSGDADVETPHQVINLKNGVPCRFVLSFTDLTYSITGKKKKTKTKTILDSITGEACEGEILAVMGASGSGKSTLIDALANRIKKQSLSGSVTLNGENVDEKQLKSISAYVTQDDLLFPMLTVEETLMFSAEFRLPRSLSRSKKKARVQALIDKLGLRFAAKTIIGDEGHRGVSGGERRRVSIGTDIIHDPIVLFLDEPTSGLDSTSAFMVVKVLQYIAQSGSIVIMSIHQPSSRIVGLLDRVMLLSKGMTVYNGTPEGFSLYFSELGLPIPENENRVEFALDFIRELELSETGNDIEQLAQFNKSWQDIKFSSKFDSDIPLKDVIATSISRGKLMSKDTRFANPSWIEMLILAKRSIINASRIPELFAIRLGAVLVTGSVLATMFWRLDDTPRGVMERLGFLAFGMSTIYYSCVEALPVFFQERYIFMRETTYNAYRRSSYVLSNAAVELPSLVVLAFAFSATTFFAVGLSGGISGFFFFFLTICTSFWAGNSFVTFLSGIIPHLMIGYTIAAAILAYFLLFSGFFINRGRIPDYWIWFHYISLVKYPYEAVLHNEFDDSNKCFARGGQIFDGTMMENMPQAMKQKALKAISGVLGVQLMEDSCVVSGLDVLEQQGVNDLNKWNCLFVTVAWGVFFRVLFYFALLLGSKNKRS